MDRYFKFRFRYTMASTASEIRPTIVELRIRALGMRELQALLGEYVTHIFYLGPFFVSVYVI